MTEPITATTLAIHILAGALGIVTGFIALFAAKGARLHRKSGMAFVYVMVTMALTGALIAAIHSTEGSVIAGLLTGYLVATGLLTVRPAAPRWVNVGLMALALAIGVTGITWGIETAAMPGAKQDGIPAGMFFMFGSVAILCSLSDIRVIRKQLQGAARLTRHLWRMSYALWIATASFFLGQADEFPKALRIPGLLATPVLVVLVVMLYWLVRVRFRTAALRLAGGTAK